MDKKMAIYLSLEFRKGCPSYRRSFHPSKENIQHFKTWNFTLWIILAFLSSDTHSQCGSGSSRPKLMQIRNNNTGFNYTIQETTFYQEKIYHLLPYRMCYWIRDSQICFKKIILSDGGYSLFTAENKVWMMLCHY